MSEKSEVELEAMADALRESGQYRVLRRLVPRPFIEPPDGSQTRLGVLVDVETTGLDAVDSEIIELAMVPFSYGLDGRIFEIRDPFHSFHQPKEPIPAEITALTGISDEMVAGHVIKPSDVASFVENSALIIAHNAAFDRRFLERLSEAFVFKPWACSMSEVDWKAEGYEGTKLAYLAMEAGFFYDRHRAVNDCYATIELLATSLPKAGTSAMAQLLEKARRPSWRIWAENSPFDRKDLLKARGYRWNADAGANPRGWFIDVDEDDKESELAYLQAEIYLREVELPVKKVTAYERFSERC